MLKIAHADNEYKALVDAANGIRKDNRAVFFTPAALQEALPGFEGLYSWLTTTDAGKLTYAALQQKAFELTGRNSDYWLNGSDALLKLWNTMLVESINQQNPMLSTFVTQALLTANAMSVPDSETYTSDLTAALSASLLLPASVFPFSRPHDEPDGITDDVENQDLLNLNKQLKQVVDVEKAVADALAAELEEANWKQESFVQKPGDSNDDPNYVPPVEPLPAIQLGYWNDSFRARL